MSLSPFKTDTSTLAAPLDATKFYIRVLFKKKITHLFRWTQTVEASYEFQKDIVDSDLSSLLPPSGLKVCYDSVESAFSFDFKKVLFHSFIEELFKYLSAVLTV